MQLTQPSSKFSWLQENYICIHTWLLILVTARCHYVQNRRVICLWTPLTIHTTNTQWLTIFCSHHWNNSKYIHMIIQSDSTAIYSLSCHNKLSAHWYFLHHSSWQQNSGNMQNCRRQIIQITNTNYMVLCMFYIQTRFTRKMDWWNEYAM